jgi:predicted MFS family arabinose efflux permease
MEYKKSYENALVAVMFLTWGTVFLDRMAVLYLAPFIAPELHLSHEQVGLLASATAVAWAFSTLLFGALSDRIGRRVVLIPMVFLFSILSILSGLARNFSQMLLARGAMGIAEGPCWSIMNATVEESSHPSRRGRNVGIVVSAAAAIGLAAAPVLTTQVAAVYGWRVAFCVAGAPGLVAGVLIWAIVREPSAAGPAAERRRKAELADFLSLLRYRNVWCCALGAAGFISWLLLQNLFGPLYITEVAHQPATTAGFLMGAGGAGSLVIGFIAPSLSDRIGRRRVLMVMGGLSFILPLALLAKPLYEHLWVLAAVLFLSHGGQAIAALMVALVPAESVPKMLAASAIGFVTLVGEIIGGTLAPFIGGALAQTYGLEVPLLMASLGALVCVLAAFLLREPGQEAAEAVARKRPAVAN